LYNQKQSFIFMEYSVVIMLPKFRLIIFLFLTKKKPLKSRSACKTQINAKERRLHKELGF